MYFMPILLLLLAIASSINSDYPCVFDSTKFNPPIRNAKDLDSCSSITGTLIFERFAHGILAKPLNFIEPDMTKIIAIETLIQNFALIDPKIVLNGSKVIGNPYFCDRHFYELEKDIHYIKSIYGNCRANCYTLKHVEMDYKNCTYFEGDLIIDENSSSRFIEKLVTLEHIGGSLTIQGSQLTNLHGLRMLRKIEGSQSIGRPLLKIYNNSQLEEFKLPGLQEILAGGSGPAVVISDNYVVPTNNEIKDWSSKYKVEVSGSFKEEDSTPELGNNWIEPGLIFVVSFVLSLASIIAAVIIFKVICKENKSTKALKKAKSSLERSSKETSKKLKIFPTVSPRKKNELLKFRKKGRVTNAPRRSVAQMASKGYWHNQIAREMKIRKREAKEVARNRDRSKEKRELTPIKANASSSTIGSNISTLRSGKT